jgi:hypothetical protein
MKQIDQFILDFFFFASKRDRELTAELGHCGTEIPLINGSKFPALLEPLLPAVHQGADQ